MDKLKVLTFPDPRLKLAAKPVEAINDDIRVLVKAMFTTMYAEDGVGLAATQVNIQKQIIVIDFADGISKPMCLINPKILTSHGLEEDMEACLSFPGVYGKVKRASQVTIEYFDEWGIRQQHEAEGIMARCFQHEIDHLNGITFYDHLSPLKQKMLKKKLKKYQELYEKEA